MRDERIRADQEEHERRHEVAHLAGTTDPRKRMIVANLIPKEAMPKDRAATPTPPPLRVDGAESISKLMKTSNDK